jgi:hypothetical protein
MLMKKFGQILLKHDRQFLSENQWVRVMGEQINPFKELPLDAFYGKYDFQANGAIDRLNQKERQANLQQNVVPFVQFYEQVRPGGVNLEELAKQYFKEFYFRNTAKLLNPPEQQQQFAQQQQQSQMQQQMMLAEHNAQAQASAQAQLSQQQSENDAAENEAEFERDISKEVVKGIMNGSKQAKQAR